MLYIIDVKKPDSSIKKESIANGFIRNSLSFSFLNYYIIINNAKKNGKLQSNRISVSSTHGHIIYCATKPTNTKETIMPKLLVLSY